MAVTVKSVISAAPLSIALPIAAIVRVYGQTIPPVGAYKAPTASSEICFSFARSWALSKISNPSTPLSSPRCFKACKVEISSAENATTSEPFRRNFTPKSAQTPSINLLPATLNFAFKLPTGASNPACTIPLFALLAPIHTSLSFSTRHTCKAYFVSSRKINPPTTPPPITTTSNIFTLLSP